MKKLHKGIVTNIEKISKNTYKLEFQTGLEKVQSGQFVSILCPPTILRRPFGIANFEDGKITIMFRMRGKGTNFLSQLKTGDEIEFNAPTGRGFLENKGKKALLIGAGIGIAPLFFLNKNLKEKNIETKLICGFNTDDEVIKGCDYVKVGGSILDDLEKIIDEYKPDIAYSCAPHIVMKLASEICEAKNLPLQVAMEKTMACGIGVCRSCVIKIKTPNGIENRTICADGPVFWGSEVVW